MEQQSPATKHHITTRFSLRSPIIARARTMSVSGTAAIVIPNSESLVLRIRIVYWMAKPQNAKASIFSNSMRIWYDRYIFRSWPFGTNLLVDFPAKVRNQPLSEIAPNQRKESDNHRHRNQEWLHLVKDTAIKVSESNPSGLALDRNNSACNLKILKNTPPKLTSIEKQKPNDLEHVLSHQGIGCKI